MYPNPKSEKNQLRRVYNFKFYRRIDRTSFGFDKWLVFYLTSNKHVKRITFTTMCIFVQAQPIAYKAFDQPRVVV